MLLRDEVVRIVLNRLLLNQFFAVFIIKINSS